MIVISRRSRRGSIAAGAAGGLAGGLVFGMVMQSAAMMPLVARLVGSESNSVGWLVHLAIAVFLGMAFSLASGQPRLVISAIGQGLLWGFAWWVVGGLILLPALIGEQILVLNSTSWRSLGGHLAYGAILGAVYGIWARRLHPGGHAISGPVDTVHANTQDPNELLPPPDKQR